MRSLHDHPVLSQIPEEGPQRFSQEMFVEVNRRSISMEEVRHLPRTRSVEELESSRTYAVLDRQDAGQDHPGRMPGNQGNPGNSGDPAFPGHPTQDIPVRTERPLSVQVVQSLVPTPPTPSTPQADAVPERSFSTLTHHLAHNPLQIPTRLYGTLAGLPLDNDFNTVNYGPTISHDKIHNIHQCLTPRDASPTGQVIVVQRKKVGDTIARELDALGQLERLGVPVPPYQGAGILHGHPALIMPEMIGHFRFRKLTMKEQLNQILHSNSLGGETVRSLTQIVRAFEQNDIKVSRMNLLMCPKTGKVYVSDPEGFRKRTNPLSSNSVDLIKGALEKIYRFRPEFTPSIKYE